MLKENKIEEVECEKSQELRYLFRKLSEMSQRLSG